MMKNSTDDIERQQLLKKFQFRGLHPNILLGTASDRYDGWTGQIYNGEKYKASITRRSKRVGGKSFVEKILPVESLEEYFAHFRVLEIDFTFYSPLLDNEYKPTNNFHILKRYRKYMREEDHVILKVPQVISAQKVHRDGKYIENESYLNADIFKKGFYEPAPCGQANTSPVSESAKSDRQIPFSFFCPIVGATISTC